MARPRTQTDDERRALKTRRQRLLRAKQAPATDRPRYLADRQYRKLVAVLADPKRLARYDSDDRANAIKIALGEIANLWPVSIEATEA